ncbi:MAG: SH3 domain-containing protein [Chloroflexi bacterium]|nr:SH3 domain-containing protein [Chloroflexota bacterium]
MDESTLTQPAVPPTPARRKRNRTLFWPGFAAGFLLLSLLSCGGLAMTMGLDRINLTSLQEGDPAWTPQPATPTVEGAQAAEPDSNATPDQASGAFRIGETVRNITNSPVNIRQSPGYLGKLPSDVINVIRPGDTIEIIAGPSPGDKLTWWRIRYNGTEGWVAEATASNVQILGK